MLEKGLPLSPSPHARSWLFKWSCYAPHLSRPMGTVRSAGILLWPLKIQDLKGMEVPRQPPPPRVLWLGLPSLPSHVRTPWQMDGARTGTRPAGPSLHSAYPPRGSVVVHTISVQLPPGLVRLWQGHFVPKLLWEMQMGIHPALPEEPQTRQGVTTTPRCVP